MMALGDTARDDYDADVQRLDLMARDALIVGDKDEANRAALGATIAYGAMRGEERNVAPGPARCHLCGGVRFCDVAAHLMRLEVWH